MAEENEEVEKKTNWEVFVFMLIVVILFVLFFRYKSNKDHKYEKTFKGETIGLTIRIKYSGKTRDLRYCFYSGGKKILGNAPIVNYDLLDKFYRVKYDINNPEKGHYIILKEELKPDSITLVKAGFTKIKYYIYDDGATCKYIEKSKWK
jgi:hypothetical protein